MAADLAPKLGAEGTATDLGPKSFHPEVTALA